tara:strand:- start:12 stop:209 length:198 start_codon:yes stop_codon:yes gene_type:complete
MLMAKSDIPYISNLEKKLAILLKKFDEQKGIINAYVKKEREWKKDKVIHRKEIRNLEKKIGKQNV